MSRKRPVRAEFSRPLAVERIGVDGVDAEIAAGPDERAALARRFGLLALDRLSARLRAVRCGRGLIRLSGQLTAEVTQACVVTLEPVPGRVEESFSQLYTLAQGAPAPGEVFVGPEGEDPPEPVGPEGIDLGEAVAQQLALALDPYPRAAGARLPEAATATPAEEGPFAALKSLKDSG